MTHDMINGLIEIIGGLFILNHCRVLYNDKKVAGVSILSTVFFTLWGVWNAFWYYPGLEQWWSFGGAIFICAMNAAWIVMMIYYRKNHAR